MYRSGSFFWKKFPFYLRGRYEVQIMDTKGQDPWVGYLGAVYGFLTPSEMAAEDPGVWQAYDITLRGRMVTIVANNKTVIWNQAIPGRLKFQLFTSY